MSEESENLSSMIVKKGRISGYYVQKENEVHGDSVDVCQKIHTSEDGAFIVVMHGRHWKRRLLKRFV